MRAALLVAGLVLLTAGAAFGIASLVSGSGASATSASQPWLGIDVIGSPLGVMVADVVPGGPAASAGLQPGDLISQINNQPVGTVDGVSAAISGLHAGDQIQIQFSRGLVPFTTQVTLATNPSGHP